MSRFFRFFAVAFLCAAAHAAPLTADLGQGLVYHRAHALPADLPTDESLRTRPCVLDLRFASGDATAATVLSAWLKFHALPRTPVFVLANAATSPALRAVLTRHTAISPVLVVIGPASPEFAADVVLAVTADADRIAYDAADQGTPLDKLLTETIDKPRNDEARLAHDRLAPSPDGELPHPSPSDPVTPATPPTPAPPALLDRVLQRAVQLHRALLALKRL